MKIYFGVILCGMAVLALAVSRHACAAGNIMLLPTLGGESSTVTDLCRSDSVQVLGWSDVSAEKLQAVLWQHSGNAYFADDLASSGDSKAYGHASDGTASYIVGYSQSRTSTSINATVWTDNGSGYGRQTLSMLPEGSYGVCYGISEDARYVVGNADNADGYYRAAVWKNNGGVFDQPTELVAIGASLNSSCALTVSSDGGIIAGYAGGKATVWLAENDVYGSAVELASLGGPSSRVCAMTGSGGIMVGDSQDSSGNQRAALWECGESGYGMAVDLGTLGGPCSAALRISEDGKIIVGWSQKDDQSEHSAAVWSYDAKSDAWKIQDLIDVLSRHGIGTTGLTDILEVTAIRCDANGKYTIAGNGINGTNSIGFALSGFSVMPEPTSFALLAFGVVMLRQRRKQK